MGGSVHTIILNEYDRKRKNALERLISRREEVYSKIPELEQVEYQIQTEGLKYNKMILLDSKHSSEAAAELCSKIEKLKERKKQLLLKHNYSPDYLEITYECPLCRDTGFVDGNNGTERCSCYKQQLINYLYKHSNLGLTRTENFDNFDENLYSDSIDEVRYGIKISPRENILKIKERCLEFIQNFSSPEEKNLFFSGPTGVGKTFMSNCISRELLEKGHTVLYQTASLLFNTINEYKTKLFRDPSYHNTSYKDLFEVDLLIIDDLGTESLSAARYAELLTILNTRHMNNLSRPCKTIISTNIGVKELYEYYDERIASRIIGSFTLLRFAGDDIRRIKKTVCK